MAWVKEQGGDVPGELDPIVEDIARGGGTPLVVAEGDRALGVVHLKDVVKGGMRERFDQLRRMGIRTVMITGDNPLTAAAIASEAGVDDFLAQATPERKLELIRAEQGGGKLIAMTGDGTNDAPALAQADVGVAMNTGTVAAKEAGNMVDLDSNPTKLIEIVEIGKQLLITRGSLTTFSIANDVAKYFAIIPALFAATYPVLDRLNILRLESPRSAVLSAVIFNALIIVALIPLALRGVRFRPVSATALLRRNLLVYGLGGIVAAVHRHQADRRRPSTSSTWPRRTTVMLTDLRRGAVALVAFTVLVGLAYPLLLFGIGQVAFRGGADGSLVRRRRPGGRLQPDRPGLRRPGYFWGRPVGRRGRLRRRRLRRLQPRARPPGRSPTPCRSGSTPCSRPNPGATAADIPAELVTASGSGLDPHISPAAAAFQVDRVAAARRLDPARVRDLVRRPHPGPRPRVPGRAEGERAASSTWPSILSPADDRAGGGP